MGRRSQRRIRRNSSRFGMGDEGTKKAQAIDALTQVREIILKDPDPFDDEKQDVYECIGCFIKGEAGAKRADGLRLWDYVASTFDVTCSLCGCVANEIPAKGVRHG